MKFNQDAWLGEKNLEAMEGLMEGGGFLMCYKKSPYPLIMVHSTKLKQQEFTDAILGIMEAMSETMPKEYIEDIFMDALDEFMG